MHRHRQVSLFSLVSLSVLLSGVTGDRQSIIAGNAVESVKAHADVIIIGAGISGIAAAKQLITEHGVNDILILEARDSIGGRAYVEHLRNPHTGHETTIEKGCNWIQGSGHENITKLARKWGLQTQVQNYSNVAWFSGKRGIESDHDQNQGGRFLTPGDLDFVDEYDAFEVRVSKYVDKRERRSLVDITARACLSIVGWLPRTPLEKLYEWFKIDFMTAQPPEICSGFNTFNDPGELQHEELVIDQRGYKYIFEQELTEAFGGTMDDRRLHLNTVVSNINYRGNQIRVTSDRGVFVARKHVLSTLSIGVLQDNLVTWTPPLPSWKKEAIYSFGMATYQKIFLLFDRPFWRDEQFLLYADPDERGRYPLWQNLNAPGFLNGSQHGYIYFVTHVDTEARRTAAMTDQAVQAEAMRKLREIYGEDIPEPLDIVVPRWDRDPYFRGSYSNWPLGELEEHHENLRQSVGDNAVFFTGEANSVDTFGYVQGAWEDGKQTADRIATCLRDGVCPRRNVYERIRTCIQDGVAWEHKRSRRGRSAIKHRA